MDDPETTIFDRFKAIVEESGLPNTKIAALMGGISSTEVGRILAGDRQSLRLDSVLNLCDALGVDPWMLAFGKPAKRLEVSLREEVARPHPDDRVERLEADLREMKEIVARLEAAAPALAAAAKEQRRRARNG